MNLIARDLGVYAKCECGSRMFIPSGSALNIPVIFCPCGEIQKLTKENFNSLMSRSLRSYVAKKSGQLYRPPAKSEERHREQTWFEEIG